jgi:hypothetical protein
MLPDVTLLCLLKPPELLYATPSFNVEFIERSYAFPEVLKGLEKVAKIPVLLVTPDILVNDRSVSEGLVLE